MFPLSIVSYVKIVVVSLLLCGCAYGYIEHSRFEEYKSEIKAIAEKQIAQNESKVKEQALINKGISNAYEAKLSAIHTYYDGMRNSSGSPMSSLSLSSSGTNVSSSDFKLDCAITTQQVVSLQDWIKEQSGL